MQVLIAYATTEGQTRKIAEQLAAHVEKHGHEVSVYDTRSTKPDLDLNAFQSIFVAGSVHHGQHQESITSFVIAHRNELQAKPAALISVSLSVGMNELKEAQGYVDGFVSETGWQPEDVLLAAGALRYSEYDYFKQQIIKFLVMSKDKSAETTRDHEFTDWDDVFSFADRFLEKAAAA